MPIRFIRDRPALLISDDAGGKKRKFLVVADLHLGLEHELFQSGIVIAPQAEKFKNTIGKLLKMTKADTLVIVGDLKHKVPGISFRELKELPKLIDFLRKRVKVILVSGNHDADLKEISENIKVYDSHGFKIGKYGFFHGHAWPDKSLLACDFLFTAHMHPAVEFVDDFGFRSIEPVWVKGRLDEKIIRTKYKIKEKNESDRLKIGKLQVIVMPPFNPIIVGTALNSKKQGHIGPLTNSGALDIRKCEAFMLDGTSLGKISKLKRN